MESLAPSPSGTPAGLGLAVVGESVHRSRPEAELTIEMSSSRDYYVAIITWAHPGNRCSCRTKELALTACRGRLRWPHRTASRGRQTRVRSPEYSPRTARHVGDASSLPSPEMPPTRQRPSPPRLFSGWFSSSTSWCFLCRRPVPLRSVQPTSCKTVDASQNWVKNIAFTAISYGPPQPQRRTFRIGEFYEMRRAIMQNVAIYRHVSAR